MSACLEHSFTSLFLQKRPVLLWQVRYLAAPLRPRKQQGYVQSIAVAKVDGNTFPTMIREAS